MEIYRDRSKGILTLSQQDYLDQITELYNMQQAKAVCTTVGAHFKLYSVKDQDEKLEALFRICVPYSNAFGSLMYAKISAKPEIAYGVSLVSRFMSRLGGTHWQAVQWLLRYI